jgi:membrane protein
MPYSHDTGNTIIMNYRQLRLVQRGLEWLFYFTRFFFSQFYKQQGLKIAASLSYATLLALVPLVTVMFGFLGGLPVFSNVGGTIQSYIFTNFVPEFGEVIFGHIESFSDKATQLTVPGLVTIFVIALMLMATIDSALNSIWHVRIQRNPVARFLVYWSILTMGPILLGAGLFSTSYLMSLPLISGAESTFGLKETLLAWLPFITTSIAFTVIYIIVPNCFILRKHAIVGGIAAAILFELAKYGFGIYVKTIPGYQTIYGALAVIPIFLIWIYVSWVVLLLGAHITFCLSAFRWVTAKFDRGEHPWSFEEVYRIIQMLWQAQKQGKSLSFPQMRKQGVKTPQHQINEIIGYLQAADWVHATGSGNWILSRDMDEVTMLDLHRIIPRPLPINARPKESENATQGRLESILQSYQESMEQNLAVPMSELLQQQK